MESSQLLGASSAARKRSGGSESGWTMYIGSQIFDRDDESDDSMASDASSGAVDPLGSRSKEESDEVKTTAPGEADKKQCKQANKRVRPRLPEKKLAGHCEEEVPKADSCESQV